MEVEGKEGGLNDFVSLFRGVVLKVR